MQACSLLICTLEIVWFSLQSFFEVVIIYLNQVLLALQVLLNIGHRGLTTCLNWQILNLFELYGFLALRMNLEIIICQRTIVAILQLNKFELVVIVVVRENILLKGSTRLSILCHCLCLHHCPLIALTLQDSLLALVLLYLRNLTALIVRVWLVSTVAFGGSGSLHLAATLRRVMTLFHDIRLRDMVHLWRLVEHLVVLLEMLREWLLVGVLALAFHEQAILLRRVYEFILRYRPGPLLRVKRRRTTCCRGTTTSVATSTSKKSFLEVLLLDGFYVVLQICAL